MAQIAFMASAAHAHPTGGSTDQADDDTGAEPMLMTGARSSHQPVGVDHIVSLGDASASLGLISTLVFSICIDRMFYFELTGSYANTAVCYCIVASCACSTFVMSFAILEFYYAQMLKKKDEEVKDNGAQDDVHALRARMRSDADSAIAALNPLRAASRNAMWLSLMLLQLGGALHMFDQVESAWEALIIGLVSVVAVCSCLLIVNNVQQFRAHYAVPTGSTPALPWWPTTAKPSSQLTA
jgi:hypothetical protein